MLLCKVSKLCNQTGSRSPHARTFASPFLWNRLARFQFAKEESCTWQAAPTCHSPKYQSYVPFAVSNTYNSWLFAWIACPWKRSTPIFAWLDGHRKQHSLLCSPRPMPTPSKLLRTCSERSQYSVFSFRPPLWYGILQRTCLGLRHPCRSWQMPPFCTKDGWAGSVPRFGEVLLPWNDGMISYCRRCSCNMAPLLPSTDGWYSSSNRNLTWNPCIVHSVHSKTDPTKQ